MHNAKQAEHRHVILLVITISGDPRRRANVPIAKSFGEGRDKSASAPFDALSVRDELSACHRSRGQDSALGSSQKSQAAVEASHEGVTATPLSLQSNAANAFRSVLSIKESCCPDPYVKPLSFFGICIERTTLEHFPTHAESKTTDPSVLAVPGDEVAVDIDVTLHPY